MRLALQPVVKVPLHSAGASLVSSAVQASSQRVSDDLLPFSMTDRAGPAKFLAWTDLCPLNATARSAEEIAIQVHVGGQIERMLPDEPLGQFRVAALQCLDDAHVIGNRARCPVLL